MTADYHWNNLVVLLSHVFTNDFPYAGNVKIYMEGLVVKIPMNVFDDSIDVWTIQSIGGKVYLITASYLNHLIPVNK